MRPDNFLLAVMYAINGPSIAATKAAIVAGFK